MKAVGKTFKDMRKFDTKVNKAGSRKAFLGTDMRTRVKPVDKKEKGGGKNWKEYYLTQEDDADLGTSENEY